MAQSNAAFFGLPIEKGSKCGKVIEIYIFSPYYSLFLWKAVSKFAAKARIHHLKLRKQHREQNLVI